MEKEIWKNINGYNGKYQVSNLGNVRSTDRYYKQTNRYSDNCEHIYKGKTLNLNKEDFTQMGLLNLKPTIRLKMYKPFIKYFEENNISFSIADNDLHYIGTNKCCCGDKLISKSTNFNNTAMIKKYGKNYSLNDLKNELGECGNCKCNYLFTSNRQEGCKTVKEYYEKRFNRKTSPFSPKFEYIQDKQLDIFDLESEESNE